MKAKKRTAHELVADGLFALADAVDLLRTDLSGAITAQTEQKVIDLENRVADICRKLRKT